MASASTSSRGFTSANATTSRVCDARLSSTCSRRAGATTSASASTYGRREAFRRRRAARLARALSSQQRLDRAADVRPGCLELHRCNASIADCSSFAPLRNRLRRATGQVAGPRLVLIADNVSSKRGSRMAAVELSPLTSTTRGLTRRRPQETVRAVAGSRTKEVLRNAAQQADLQALSSGAATSGWFRPRCGGTLWCCARQQKSPISGDLFAGEALSRTRTGDRLR